MKATRRETLRGIAVLAAAEKLTDGGLAPVSLPGAHPRQTDILPPGAGDREKFLKKCIGCGLCIAECPEHALSPSTSATAFGRPRLDFRRGYCQMHCVRCTRACPTGALKVLQADQRPFVHLGAAWWKRELCLRATTGEKCTACVRKCPKQAIHLVSGFPVIDRDSCIGCGACEHVCPARPLPAIHVKGFDVQRMTTPMAEADLLAEMQAKVKAGATLVVARDGVIVETAADRGIAQLLKFFDEGKLARAVVLDKAVGRAAAAIYALGRAKKVVTPMAGEGAAEILAAHGVEFVAGKTVPRILNHAMAESCPMEAAVADLAPGGDCEKMLAAIRERLKKLQAKKK